MSTQIEHRTASIQIPKSILDKLDSIVQRHQMNERIIRWGGLLTLGIIALLIMIVTDIALELDSVGTRLVGWLIAISSVLTLGFCWEQFLEQPLSWRDAAWRVESVRPEIDERLSSTIELFNEQSTSANTSFSPQLFEALSHEAALATANVDSHEIPLRANWPVKVALASSITLFLLVTVINPVAVFRSIQGWLMLPERPLFTLQQSAMLSDALLTGELSYEELPADTSPEDEANLSETEAIQDDALPIDPTLFEERWDAEQRAMQAALDAASQELLNAKAAVEQLGEELQKETDGTAGADDSLQQIVSSKEALERLAETMENASSDYSEQVNRAREIRDDNVEAAEQQLKQISESNELAHKRELAEQSHQDLDQAVDKLRELKQQLQEKAKAQKTAIKLDDLARKQQEIADELGTEQTTSESDWQKRQQQVADELDDMQPEVRQAERAEQLAEQAREIADSLEQLEKSQDTKQPVPQGENEQQQLMQEQQAVTQKLEGLEKDLEQLQAEGMPDETSQEQLMEARSHLEQASEQRSKADDRSEKNRSEENHSAEARTEEQRTERNSKSSPAESIRKAADALEQVCRTCRECAECRNPGEAGSKMSEACRGCKAAANAPTRQKAERHARKAADELAELAEHKAQQSGLRKSCENCNKPGEGKDNANSSQGNNSAGTKSVTELPFERLPLRGGASSGWTRAKRQLQTGILDGREALIPEAYRDVITEYFEALAKQTDEIDRYEDSRQ